MLPITGPSPPPGGDRSTWLGPVPLRGLTSKNHQGDSSVLQESKRQQQSRRNRNSETIRHHVLEVFMFRTCRCPKPNPPDLHTSHLQTPRLSPLSPHSAPATSHHTSGAGAAAGARRLGERPPRRAALRRRPHLDSGAAGQRRGARGAPELRGATGCGGSGPHGVGGAEGEVDWLEIDQVFCLAPSSNGWPD